MARSSTAELDIRPFLLEKLLHGLINKEYEVGVTSRRGLARQSLHTVLDLEMRSIRNFK